MELPIYDDHCLLQKPDVKGGWTFISMPVMPNLPKKKGTTTVRVRGFIDQYELKNFNIWAMKKGTFLAVKAEIRKAIQKAEGDTVNLCSAIFTNPAERALVDLEPVEHGPHFSRNGESIQLAAVFDVAK